MAEEQSMENQIKRMKNENSIEQAMSFCKIKKMKLILYMLPIMLLTGCKVDSEESKFTVDHVNIWLKNPRIAKDKLEEIGFQGIPDSLCLIHTGQGTTGRYFYFLNSYLEFIFINDEEEFEDNAEKNKELDFIERVNNHETGFLPFSIALKMENYNKDQIPFEVIPYAQDWMGESNKIYAAKNSKIKKEEPSLFIIYPEIAYDVFENKKELSKIPEEYSIWREFYKHKNGAEKISKIKIHSSELDPKSETVKMLKKLKEVELVEGEEYLMELYFDNQKKNEIYDMRPEIPLKIYL